MSMNVIGRVARCFLLGFGFIIVGCGSVPRGLGDPAADEPATQSIDGKMMSIDAKRMISRGGGCVPTGQEGACCLPDLPAREAAGLPGCIETDERCCDQRGGLFAAQFSCMQDAPFSPSPGHWVYCR